MYSGSAEFNNLIAKAGGEALKTRFVFSDFVLENFTKLEYRGGSNSGENISIGTANMAYLEVEAITDKVLTNQEFLFEAGFLINGEYEYAPIGHFTIQMPKDEETVSFEAFDRMQRFEKPYTSNLTYPTTTDKIVAEICSKCNVELATPIGEAIQISEKPQGYTCREIIGYIAGIHGLFACIDRNGKLNLRWYNASAVEVPVSLMWEFTKNQSDFSVDKITIAKDGETTFTAGNGMAGIEVSNPLATQEITNSIYKKLGGYKYRPCTVSMLDDIRIDPWDVIKVVYLDGNIYTFPVMSISHSFTSGETRVAANGKSDIESEYRYDGPVTKSIERTATELLIANRVIATKVDAEWVRANTITADKLEATNARIYALETNSLTAEQADLKYANITLGNIDTANINKANIGLLFAEVGLLTSATIMNGHVTGYLDSVEINANSITAGTLVTDRLVFRGQEKSIVYELNNITGALQAVQSNTLNGEILTNRSITVDKIVAHSITSNEIAASTITAFNIASGTITSEKLNVNEIFGNNAIINKIFAQDITATGSITSPILKSADYAYKGDGHSYSLNGMKVDLKNKEISTPSLYISGNAAMSDGYAVLKATLGSNESSIAPSHFDVTDGILTSTLQKDRLDIFDNDYYAWYGHSRFYITYKVDNTHTVIRPGDIDIRNNHGDACIILESSGRKLGIYSTTRQNLGLYDETNSSWILYSDTNQNVNIPHPLSVTASLSASSITATSGSVVAAANIYAGATSDTATRSVYARNSLRSIRMLANASGVIGLFNDTNNIFILQSSTANEIQIGESSKTASITLSHTNGRFVSNGSGVEIYGGTPYIDFHFGSSGQDYTSRLVESESGVLVSMGTLRSNKNLGLGFGDATVTYALTSKWKDGNQHNLVERNADGLSSYFGWAGSSTYPTRTILRGRSIEFNAAGDIIPTNDSLNYLGNGSHRFKQLFATTGAISTSDRNQKCNIVYDLNKTDAIFDALKPCSYYRVGGDRMHFGLVAQEVEQAYLNAGISINDVGLICRDHIYHKGDSGEKIYHYNAEGAPEYRYGLRYEELHGLEIWQIQRLKKRINEVEQKNMELEEKTAKAELKIAELEKIILKLVA